MAGHSQVISRMNKGNQNILIYNFIITTFDCQGSSQGGSISARVNTLARPGVAPPLDACTLSLNLTAEKLISIHFSSKDVIFS